jgi:hypothetical protein
MSSIFEGPPQDSRIASAPRLSPRPWTTMIAAFAAGVAVTFLFVTISSFVDRPAPPETKLSQRLQSSTNAAGSGSAAVPANPAPSAEPKQADPKQADPDTTRAAEVVSVPPATPRSTDGSAKTQATKAVAPPVELTTNGGVPTERAAGRAQELAGSPREQAQVGTTVAPPTDNHPVEPPQMAARPTPAQASPKISTEKSSRPAEAPVRESPRTRVATPREPQAASRREPQQAASPREPRATSPRELQAASPREPQHVSRAANERFTANERLEPRRKVTGRETSRTGPEPERRLVRQEADDEPDDPPLGPRVRFVPETDDDYTPVRVRRLPDSRRTAIYERRTTQPTRVTDDDDDAPPPPPRPPFVFNPAKPGD